jgi:chitin synthase
LEKNQVRNRLQCLGRQSTVSHVLAGLIGIQGWMFNISQSAVSDQIDFYALSAGQNSGVDVTDMFDQSAAPFPACNGVNAAYATTNLCTNSTPPGTPKCTLGALGQASFDQLKITNTSRQVGYTWDQLVNMHNFFVIDGNVLNLTPYMLAHPNAIANDPVDTAIRYTLQTMNPAGGKDATMLFANHASTKDATKCLEQRYKAGRIDKVTPGCFASQLFLYCSLVIILGLVLARFLMAVVFNWFLSRKLIQPPKNLKRHGVSPAVMPVGANLTKESRAGTAPWTGAKLQKGRAPRNGNDWEKEDKTPMPADHNGMISMASIGAELFCVCLVTCYSEGEEGIRTTLDSIAGSNYSDARKLLFVVCDGMITGSGESKSTPDICVGMIEADPRFGTPTPMSYLAVAAGQKAHNQAMVYVGHYSACAPVLCCSSTFADIKEFAAHVRGHRTPIIVVVKCGTPAEANDKKPGNRGKRDSQMILMNFFSSVTYNSRMTPLDYDLFRKSQALMGVTPDFFEVCLMVRIETMLCLVVRGYSPNESLRRLTRTRKFIRIR